MADIAIFRINYKSDFILTLQSDAGWTTPFCVKFWTGAPSKAYYAYYDGMSYTHCTPVEGEPTKLLVQFDDHHLPIGDLKFQIGYHFTVADFPTSIEDEVINQASVIIEVDDAPAQVMLDFNGETAPEIEFSLPAYANEAQRIANEQARIAAEEQRIANEQARISAEETRQANEQQRINQETARVNEFARLKTESEAATNAATTAASTADTSARNADEKAALAQAAATLANAKAQLAADKAALAQAAATLANEKAALAQQKAEYAQEQGDVAKTEAETAHALNEEVRDDEEARDQAEQTRQQQEAARQQAESQRVTDFNAQMQQQQTAYADAEAVRDTAFDEAETERDAKVDAKVADITNLQAQIGYFVCDTNADTAAKTITATGYALTTGGNIRIKMTNANTAYAVTLNINNTGAKALFYNGVQASSTNSWEAGEVVEVYYDGTQYQCVSGGGGKFATGEKVNDISLLNNLNNSGNLPKSSAVKQYVDSNLGTGGDSDVDNILLPWVKGVVNSDGKTVTVSNSAIYILLYDITGATYIEVTQTSNSNDKLYILNAQEQVIHSISAYNGKVHIEFADYDGAKYVSLSLNSGNNRSFDLGYVKSIRDVLQEHSEEIEDLNDAVFENELVSVTYDETQVENGFLNYGAFISNSYCRLTPFIPVSGGETIYISGKDVNNGISYASVTCYDSEQALLQPIEPGTATAYTNKAVFIPNNVRYIKVCCADSTNPVIKKDGIPTDKFSSFQTQIDDTNTRIDNIIPYTFYPTDIPFTIELTGYRFLNTSLSAAAGYVVTNYIPVIEGKKLHIVVGGQGSGLYYNGVWYDENKFVKSTLTQKGLILWNTYEIEVPTGAKYLRLCSTMEETIRLYYIHDKTTAEELTDSFYKALSIDILNGSWNSDGTVSNGSDNRYKRCSLVVHKGEKYKFKVHDYAGSVGAGSFMLYDSQNEVYHESGTNVCCIPELLTVPYDGILYLAGTNYNSTPTTSFEVFKYDVSSNGGGKKSFPRAIHTCGHSFWNGDGLAYTQFGQTKTRKGYQSYFKDFYDFPSFNDLKYDGHSLGAQSASDSYSIALKVSSWQGSEGDLWCLDTITNDFKRNIPLGTLDDYNAVEPSALTYYGALRIFRNKIVELCGSTVACILSNATHRNNSGYTSTSTNSVGCKLIDYSNAAMCVAEIEGWNFVDVFNYGGIFDDNLADTTIDGLHPNNLGYKLSVKPWLEQLGILFELL